MTGEPRRLRAVSVAEPDDGPAGESRLSMDDASLLERSRLRPEQFAVIYSRYFGEIYRYIASRLGADTADDLAADAFLIAFRRRDEFDRALGSVRPWLYGIATRLISQHQRAEARRYRSLCRARSAGSGGSDPVHDGEHEDRIADRLTAAALRAPLAAALGALPARDRDVLLLVAIAELSYAEVAQALSISQGTVGSRLNRARKTVRAALTGVYPVLIPDGLAAAGNVAPTERGAGHAGHR